MYEYLEYRKVISSIPCSIGSYIGPRPLYYYSNKDYIRHMVTGICQVGTYQNGSNLDHVDVTKKVNRALQLS